jgi:hypothetical protein
MDATTFQYADWKAPAEDGRLLIWPEPKQLLADARENHRRLSDAEQVRVQGVPLPQVRKRLRQWIGHTD